MASRIDRNPLQRRRGEAFGVYREIPRQRELFEILVYDLGEKPALRFPSSECQHKACKRRVQDSQQRQHLLTIGRAVRQDVQH